MPMYTVRTMPTSRNAASLAEARKIAKAHLATAMNHAGYTMVEDKDTDKYGVTTYTLTVLNSKGNKVTSTAIKTRLSTRGGMASPAANAYFKKQGEKKARAAAKMDTCKHPNEIITQRGHSFWTKCPDCGHVQA